MPIDQKLLSRVRDDHPTLTHLDLSSEVDGVTPGYSVAELRELAAALLLNTHLTSITFRKQYLGKHLNECAEELGAALATHPGLRKIDLTRNNIDDEGAIKLAQAFRTTHTVRIELAENNIHSEGMGAWLETVKINPNVDVNLTYNVINKLGKSDECGLEYLVDIQTILQGGVLTTLDLTGNLLETVGLQALVKKLTNGVAGAQLVSLNLTDTFNSAGMDWHRMQILLPLLKNNQKLQYLNLSSNGIQDYALKDLCEALFSCQALVSLNVEKNLIGSQGAQYLANFVSQKLPDFEELIVNDNKMDEGPLQGKALNVLLQAIGSSQLERVGLARVQISGYCHKTGLDALADNTELKELNLSGNHLYKAGMLAVVAILNNDCLKDLKLRNSDLIDPSRDEILGAGLQKAKQLRFLDLSLNNLDIDEAQHILNCAERVSISFRENKFAIGDLKYPTLNSWQQQNAVQREQINLSSGAGYSPKMSRAGNR